MDARLSLNAIDGTADLALVDGDLDIDNGLATALAISLFSDARAAPVDGFDDPIEADPRGWWGEGEGSDAIAHDRFGSLLWLIQRAKATHETTWRVENYIRRSLDWLIEDRWAGAVEVSAFYPGPGVLEFEILIRRTGGEPENYNFTLNRS